MAPAPGGSSVTRCIEQQARARHSRTHTCPWPQPLQLPKYIASMVPERRDTSHMQCNNTLHTRACTSFVVVIVNLRIAVIKAAAIVVVAA